MKNTLKLFAVCLLTTVFISCRKDIPSDKQGFIGDWKCLSCSFDEIKTLNIKSNGQGDYKSEEPGKTFNISGNVNNGGGPGRQGGRRGGIDYYDNQNRNIEYIDRQRDFQNVQ